MENVDLISVIPLIYLKKKEKEDISAYDDNMNSF